MKNGPVNVFNSEGAPSETMKRKLLYLAETGSKSVLSGFRGEASAFSAGHNKESDADAHFMVMAGLVMASQERVEQFREQLDLLDQASLEALYETEEKLQEAEEELERIRSRAHVATRPDGSKVRVYRDGEVVRDEGGNLIEFLTPNDLPTGTPELSEVRSVFRKIDSLADERQNILEYRERRAAAEDRLDQGAISQAEFEDLKAGLEDMPESVRLHRDRIMADRNSTSDRTVDSVDRPAEKTLPTSIEPTRDFGTVAPMISADDFAALPKAESDNDRNTINPGPPGASMPAPG